MLELAFVMSPEQNWFFFELVAAIRDELDRQGVRSSLSTDGFPEPVADRVYVLVPPHEYVALEGREALPPAEALKRTIFVCAEQPRTSHFEDNVELGAHAGAVFDINARSVRLLNHQGICAQHLRLGYTPEWDHYGADRERPLDAVFIGCHTRRRSRYLNEYARVLSRWNCHIQISDNSTPNSCGSPSFLAGDSKWNVLSRAKVLINLHQGDEPYFEWLRALDAIHCGCVLVTERSSGFAPLEPGRHFLSGGPKRLGLIADRLLCDEKRRAAIRDDAYEFLRSELPFSTAVAALADAGARLARPQPVAWIPDQPVSRTDDGRAGSPPFRYTDADPDTAALRRAIKDTRLDVLEMRRQIAQLTDSIPNGDDRPATSVRILAGTNAWRAHRSRRATILTALFNHRDTIGEALDSVAKSTFRDVELVVVDDGSSDGSADAVREWMRHNDQLAVLLVQHRTNRGLGAARNTALDFARGEYCFILDADNAIYPRCLHVLVSALEEDSNAAFAYPMLETFGMPDALIRAGGDYLLSKFAWEPERLRRTAWVDAMSLIRADALRGLSGFTTDRRLYGWEDYDLWCRMADRGLNGCLVPQILGRYRTSPTSMLSLTNLSVTSALAAVIERSPRLMAGVTPPL